MFSDISRVKFILSLPRTRVHSDDHCAEIQHEEDTGREAARYRSDGGERLNITAVREQAAEDMAAIREYQPTDDD